MPVAGGLAALAAGFVVTFLNNKFNEERKARIERINMQLKLFYGPLLACVATTKRAYDAMLTLHSPDGKREAFQHTVQQEPGSAEGKAYRLWMESVIQPLNEKAAAIIQGHLDLLDSSGIEQQLLQMVAHTMAYRVILEKWRQGDYDAWSAVSYPDRLFDYINKEFARLKQRQAELLGIKPRIVQLSKL